MTFASFADMFDQAVRLDDEIEQTLLSSTS